ncbi:helix-turn-helix domain-containing protein [Mycobacterium avium]|uniref:helix-turn-helix domain-containing protein n=1 Tax=Mycobacterium avium TaxID=1764 RepID=UPI002665EA7E|nr:helix-turn-helix domain-containing protein [Mycobacterium avium]MDO2354669.1 helix-turn-helix domain-containing protein [Mycobacterium avium subsp. hominissuis]
MTPAGVRHLPGATVLSPEVVAELCGVLAFVDTELAGRSRVISGRLVELHKALAPGVAPHATDLDADTLAALIFRHEFDPKTTAKLIGVEEDTVRKYLRDGTILRGRKVGQRWLVPLSEIENYHRKAV